MKYLKYLKCSNCLNKIKVRCLDHIVVDDENIDKSHFNFYKKNYADKKVSDCDNVLLVCNCGLAERLSFRLKERGL